MSTEQKREAPPNLPGIPAYRIAADDWRRESTGLPAIRIRAESDVDDLGQVRLDRRLLLRMVDVAMAGRRRNVEHMLARLREDNAGLLAAADAEAVALRREVAELSARLGGAAAEVTQLAAQVDAALLAPLRSVLLRPGGGGCG